MKPIVKVVQALAVVCAVVFVVALFANEPEPVRRADTATQDEADGGGDGEAVTVDGAAVFSERCASCHGATGDGANGPKLSDGQAVEQFPDIADQIAVVTDGRGGMPSFDSRLTEAEIEAVVEYTRTL